MITINFKWRNSFIQQYTFGGPLFWFKLFFNICWHYVTSINKYKYFFESLSKQKMIKSIVQSSVCISKVKLKQKAFHFKAKNTLSFLFLSLIIRGYIARDEFKWHQLYFILQFYYKIKGSKDDKKSNMMPEKDQTHIDDTMRISFLSMYFYIFFFRIKKQKNLCSAIITKNSSAKIKKLGTKKYIKKKKYI